MKKLLTIIVTLFFIILILVYVLLKNVKQTKINIEKENKEFETYLSQEIYGTEIATLINKIIDKNEKNEILKDEKGYYIENETNSIVLEVKILSTNLTYRMEEFYNNDISEFVKYFNVLKFKCTNIEYNKTGRIKKIFFMQIEE